MSSYTAMMPLSTATMAIRSPSSAFSPMSAPFPSAGLSAPSLSPSSSFESLASSAMSPRSPFSVPSSPNVRHNRVSCIIDTTSDFDSLQPQHVPNKPLMLQTVKLGAPPKPRVVSLMPLDDELVRDDSTPFSPIMARQPSHSFLPHSRPDGSAAVAKMRPIMPTHLSRSLIFSPAGQQLSGLDAIFEPRQTMGVLTQPVSLAAVLGGHA